MPLDHSPYYPLPSGDLTPLDRLQINDTTLDQEINLLRSYIRRVTLRQNEAATVLESAGVLRAVSFASFSLTQLIRANQAIKEARQPILTFKDTLRQISLEMESRASPEPPDPTDHLIRDFFKDPDDID